MEENDDQRDGMRVEEKVDEMAKHGDRKRTEGSEEDKEKGETGAMKDSSRGKSVSNRSEEKEGTSDDDGHPQQADGVVGAGTGNGEADGPTGVVSGEADGPTGVVSGEADGPTGTASTMSAPQQGEHGDDDGTVGEEDTGSGYEIDFPGERCVVPGVMESKSLCLLFNRGCMMACIEGCVWSMMQGAEHGIIF